MDIRELKKLLKNSASVLVLDNGEPAYVVLDYQVYRNLVLGPEREDEVAVRRENQPNGAAAGREEIQKTSQSSLSQEELAAIERLNKEIQALKGQIEAEEAERKEEVYPEQ